MKLPQTTAYAIQAMLQLARADARVPVSCRQVARAGRMPRRFLLQILRCLVNHGLLKSTRGVDGGYCLTRPPNQTTLCDIIEAIDDSFGATAPKLKGMSAASRGKLFKSLQKASRAAQDELRKISVADLLRAK